jgi:agmatinase
MLQCSDGAFRHAKTVWRNTKADQAARRKTNRPWRPGPLALLMIVHRPQPCSMMTSFAYQSDNRFLKVPAATGTEPYAVAGIAWDGSTTNRPGARFGPRAIRQASHMLCDGVHPLFDVSPDGLLADAGDLPLPNTSLDGMRAAMPPLVDALIRKHHMAWIGGDHSITLPLLRCYKRWLGRPLAVIHFDAHCDTWSDHFGEPSGHGTWVYEAMSEGLVINECFMQLGIRSAGLRFDARSLRGLENAEQLAPVLATMRERLAKHGHPPLYLSLDIDALDPAFAPGTGTPEPGGLTTNQVFTVLEELAGLPFVGMDCVEVAPPYDHAELSSYAAARFVWTYLCGQLSARRRRQQPEHRIG